MSSVAELSKTHSHSNYTFTISEFTENKRLQVVTLSSFALEQFEELSEKWSVQALEYKPFLRFAIAHVLDQCCNHALGKVLRDILLDRSRGGFLFQYDGKIFGERDAFFVKLSTAISHLIGVPNLDSMYGKYYARFTVKNSDNSDSYLRKAHRRLELHNDGTYVDERTDFVLMMKIHEAYMEGGDSLLLHIDDWTELDRFYHHPLAKQDIEWCSPPSKNVPYNIKHPIFFEEDKDGKPHMLYIDQFANPQNMREGLYLYELGESLERDENCFAVKVPVGAMLVVQNHIWLHGRDQFQPHEKLERELLRQRGHFNS